MICSISIRRVLLLAGTAALPACAATSPSAPPSDEVLLVVNSTEQSLSVVPVENSGAGIKIPLGPATANATPVGVSAANGIAIVPLGLVSAVAVVDLKLGTVPRIIPLEANSGATGSAVVNDSIAYVANPNLNTVTRVNYLTGDTASVAVGVFPQGVVFTRGKIFVLNGNLVNFSVAGESWISVIDPATNTVSDSIGLQPPGNAGFSDVSPSNGLLYVMNTGGYNAGDQGRLSVVDPVAKEELASFGGFGHTPQAVAVGGNRLYISSYDEGLMVFDIDKNKVIHGAGDGVPIPLNAGVVVDSKGRIYALDSGPCSGGIAGKAHVLDANLNEKRTITLGECPSGALVTFVPPS
jgi:hypothetical protein